MENLKPGMPAGLAAGAMEDCKKGALLNSLIGESPGSGAVSE